MMSREELLDYLKIGDDVLKRYVDLGLPCEWTGGAPGCGKVLFHRGVVDDWFRERMLDAARRRAAADARAAAASAPRRGGAARKSGGRWVH